MANITINELTAATSLADGNEFEIEASSAARKVTSQQIRDYVQDATDTRTFNVPNNGTDDAATTLQSWFTEVSTNTGLGYIPAGDYRISTSISNATLARDITVFMHPDARVFLNTGVNVPCFVITGTGNQRVRFEGGVIDCTLGSFAGGDQTSSGLAVTDLRSLHVSDIDFIGALNDERDQTGDAGITEVDVTNGWVEGCRFFGWSDNGIYLSGGATTATTDDGEGFTIVGNHFERNAIGITSRRLRRGTRIIGNSFFREGVGFLESHINTLGTAQTTIVANNNFRDIVSRAVELRGSKGSIVTGNQIEDVGYDLTDAAVTTATGIRLTGAQEAIVANNIVRLRNRVLHSGMRGITTDEITLDAVAVQSFDNLFNGNTISGLQQGFREFVDGGPNFGQGNLFINIAGTVISTLNAGSDVTGFTS